MAQDLGLDRKAPDTRTMEEKWRCSFDRKQKIANSFLATSSNIKFVTAVTAKSWIYGEDSKRRQRNTWRTATNMLGSV